MTERPYCTPSLWDACCHAVDGFRHCAAFLRWRAAKEVHKLGGFFGPVALSRHAVHAVRDVKGDDVHGHQVRRRPTLGFQLSRICCGIKKEADRPWEDHPGRGRSAQRADEARKCRPHLVICASLGPSISDGLIERLDCSRSSDLARPSRPHLPRESSKVAKPGLLERRCDGSHRPRHESMAERS